jgi:hypothetical protein
VGVALGPNDHRPGVTAELQGDFAARP